MQEIRICFSPAEGSSYSVSLTDSAAAAKWVHKRDAKRVELKRPTSRYTFNSC